MGHHPYQQHRQHPHQVEEPVALLGKALDVPYTGNKDQEVGTSTYEGQLIQPYESLEFSSCGRSDASSGTEGNFDLVDPSASDKQIRHFYWDCPWGSKDNSWSVTGSNSKFMIEHYGANYSGGGLGTITIDVLNKLRF